MKIVVKNDGSIYSICMGFFRFTWKIFMTWLWFINLCILGLELRMEYYYYYYEDNKYKHWKTQLYASSSSIRGIKNNLGLRWTFQGKREKPEDKRKPPPPAVQCFLCRWLPFTCIMCTSPSSTIVHARAAVIFASPLRTLALPSPFML